VEIIEELQVCLKAKSFSFLFAPWDRWRDGEKYNLPLDRTKIQVGESSMDTTMDIPFIISGPGSDLRSFSQLVILMSMSDFHAGHSFMYLQELEYPKLIYT
jgi:hypothetical protein